MKQRIFMYLFIFSVLLVLFQYINSKKVFEAYEKDIIKLTSENRILNDSIIKMEDRISDLLYFNIEQNEDALSYFEDKGYDVSTLIPHIKDELYSLNEQAKDGHPLIPYVLSEDKPMIINRVKLLNHKWIIADFSDGKYWGELFIKYQVNDKEVDFELLDSFIYPVPQ